MPFLCNRPHAHVNLGSCFFLIFFLRVCSLSLFSFKSDSLPVCLLSVLPTHLPSPNPIISLPFTVTPVSGPWSMVLPSCGVSCECPEARLSPASRSSSASGDWPRICSFHPCQFCLLLKVHMMAELLVHVILRKEWYGMMLVHGVQNPIWIKNGVMTAACYHNDCCGWSPVDRWEEGRRKGEKDIISPFTHSCEKRLLSTYFVLTLMPGVENMDIK